MSIFKNAIIPTKKVFSIQQLFMLLVVSISLPGLSQVGIGTTTPDPSSLLHIEDGLGNKGMLIPQIALTGTNVSAPVISPATGLLIYNTATNGSGVTAVSPGYYYWDGSQWISITATNRNLYNTDDTLTSDRTVTFGSFDLNFDNRNREINFNNGNNPLSFTRRQLYFSLRTTASPLDFRHSIGTRHSETDISGNSIDFFIWNPGLGVEDRANLMPFTIAADKVVVNEDSHDIDFRVETQSDFSTFFIEGSSDDVGIGTNAPGARLEIKQNVTTTEIPIARFTSGNNRSLDILQPSTNIEDPFTFFTNNAFEFRVDASDRLTISSLGRVGISQNSPQTAFHIGGASSVARIDALNSTNNVNNDGTRSVPVHVSTDGDFILPSSPSSMEYIYNGVDSITLTTLNTLSNGGLNSLVLDNSGSFTLTQSAFIQINYATSFSISNTSFGAINDVKAKLIRNRLNIYDTSSGSDVLLERGGHDSVAYTNQSSAGTVSIGGFFNTSGSTAILLTPGTYRIDLEAIVAANTANNGTTSDAFVTQWFVEHLKIIASY